MAKDEDRGVMIANAIGCAVLALKFSGGRISEYMLSEKLEEMRRNETNVIGKGVYRDAAELVRKGRSPVA
ncbi:MAG: hypothetical protein QM578_09465 [Pantoea sp.]|uniref:hypothetical protein n=1 Tax=Pantoea sp. TaxID=69393 RepID=UPI0039E5C55B